MQGVASAIVCGMGWVGVEKDKHVLPVCRQSHNDIVDASPAGRIGPTGVCVCRNTSNPWIGPTLFENLIIHLFFF